MTIGHAIATFRGHDVPHFDFIGRKKWWFALSGVVVALSLWGLLGPGLNFSIAFTGGSSLQFENGSGASVADYQGVMARFGRNEAQVEILGDNQVSIRTESLTDLGLRADELRQAVAREAGLSPNEINEQDVGPTWGGTISSKALTALIVFLVVVTIYISLRFEPKMAAGALVALVHDVIIVTGIYALVGREVTPETVIAVLTILGYSLYDAVVIYDKVKENAESPSLVARESYSGVANLALNQTFMRSINTSLVVLLPIGALLWFGGQTLKDFAFALFIGVACGAYSSVFIGTPVTVLLKEREPRFQHIRAKVEGRAVRPGLRAVPASTAKPEAGRELEPASVVPSGETTGTRPAAARPRPAGGQARRRRGKPQGKPKRRRR